MNVLRSDTSNPAFARDKRWGTPNTAAVSIPSELSFENVSHSIEDTPIVQDVSLVAKSGTVTCLLGPSGSGKTTLLRIAAGMFRQSAGRILLDKQEIGGPNVFLPPEERGIGLVFQDYALFPHLTIGQNVGMGLRPDLRLTATQKDAVNDALRDVGLAGMDQRKPAQLSGGQQSRAALARVLLADRPVVLLDEPFAALGPGLRREMLALVREKLAGRVVIMVTHDPDDARSVADQVVLVTDGVAAAPVALGPLFDNPPQALREYLGLSDEHQPSS